MYMVAALEVDGRAMAEGRRQGGNRRFAEKGVRRAERRLEGIGELARAGNRGREGRRRCVRGRTRNLQRRQYRTQTMKEGMDV